MVTSQLYLCPLVVIALVTIIAFIVGIHDNFDNLSLLWKQCASCADGADGGNLIDHKLGGGTAAAGVVVFFFFSIPIPTPLCFAVRFFQTALDSNRSRLEEAVIVAFLAGLATITAVEGERVLGTSNKSSSSLCPTHGSDNHLGTPYQVLYGDDRTDVAATADGGTGTGKIDGDQTSENRNENSGVEGLSLKIIKNLTFPWLLYNLAAGALAWQGIIIPAFLHRSAAAARTEHLHYSPVATIPSTQRTSSDHDNDNKEAWDAAGTARLLAIPLSIAVGLIVPSTMMILGPSPTVVLVWLVFPVWVSLVRRIVHAGIPPATTACSCCCCCWHPTTRTPTSMIGSILLYVVPVLYSAASHILLLLDVLYGQDDRNPATRSAVLLLEIDHIAIFVAFVYWIWIDSVAAATGGGGGGSSSSRPVFITISSTLLLGPGAGVCLGWAYRDHLRHSNLYSLRRDRQGTGTGSDPGTTNTNVGRPRSRPRAKATGHFFGGPFAS